MVKNGVRTHPVLALAERRHTPPDRGDLLAHTEVEACNARGVAQPGAGHSVLRYRLQGPKDHAIAPAD
jgi:hypothetical protein